MSQPPRPLVPAPSGLVRGGQDAGQAYQAEARHKRESGPKARAACDPCRSRKTKCDAQRPVCGACALRDTSCEYDIPPDTSRYTSLKRKHQDLEKENTQLLELFHMLKHRPGRDAHSILDRIRASDDLLSVLAFIRDGDLLVQARTTSKAPAWSPPPSRANSSTETLLNTYHTNAYPTLAPLEDSATDLGQKRESILDIVSGGSSTLTDDEMHDARYIARRHGTLGHYSRSADPFRSRISYATTASIASKQVGGRTSQMTIPSLPTSYRSTCHGNIQPSDSSMRATFSTSSRTVKHLTAPLCLSMPFLP
jgi:hypothetical protein